MARPHLLLQITDTHLYADPGGRLKGVTTDATARAVIARARETHPAADLVLATGDLVHDESKAGYERLRQHFATLAAPVCCLPGNHDDATLLRRVLAGEPACWRREVRLGDWLCICLDSSLPGETGGHLGEEELAALDRCLTASDAAHVLVAVHHPPVRVGSAWLDSMLIDDGQALLARLAAEPRVRALVCGHIHQALDVEIDGLRLLGTPSTCIQFLPGSRTFALDPVPPGYRWLMLYPDGRIDTGVERLPGLPADLELTPEGYD